MCVCERVFLFDTLYVLYTLVIDMDIIALWLRTYFVYVSISIVYYWIVERFYTRWRKEHIHIILLYIHIIIAQRKYVSDIFFIFI